MNIVAHARACMLKGNQNILLEKYPTANKPTINNNLIYLSNLNDILKKILPQKVAHKNHIAPIPGIQNGSVYVSPAPYKAA